MFKTLQYFNTIFLTKKKYILYKYSLLFEHF